MRILPGAADRRRAYVVAIALLCITSLQLLAQNHAVAPSLGEQLTAEQVAIRLEEKNQERALALRQVEGSRIYHMHYQGLGTKDAQMKVQMDFEAPANKRFTVVSQDGSKFIIDHVFKKLMQSEQEATGEENRRRTALSRENYEFSLVAYEPNPEGGCYVLRVSPRTKNKFLYRGKIWVDAKDFAVTSIQAEPAASPSFWITKTEIAHQYVKVGDFWLPAQNRTESQIRFGGRASLTIEYTNYKIISVAPSGKAASAQLPPAPRP